MCARRSTRPATSSRMPDASPAGGRPVAPDQPTTDLNRLWARPAAPEDGASAEEWGAGGGAYAARGEAETTVDGGSGANGTATAPPSNAASVSAKNGAASVSPNNG